jgi:hypothetical protein
VNVAFYPIDWVERHIHGNVKARQVDPLELSALMDLAVLVPGQRLDDEMACIARQGDPALGVVMADGHGAYDVVTPVAGIERQSACCRTVDTACGVLDAHGHPDSHPRVGAGASGADAVYAGNGETVNMAGRKQTYIGG